MTKICIWGAWYESQNAGDQAILMAVAHLLSQQIPDLELVVFSNRPRFTEAYMREVYPVRAFSQRHELPTVLRELASSDLFVVGGGTPFYDDWFHLLAMLLLVGTTRLAGKRVMTYAVSARPVDSLFSRCLAWTSLRLINLVTAREPWSADHLRRMGAAGRVYLFTDPAVALVPAEQDEAASALASVGVMRRDESLLAICPHFFSPEHPYRVHHYEQLSEGQIRYYHEALALAADWLSQRGRVIFVPLNTESPDDDRETINAVLGLMRYGDRCHTLRQQYGPRMLAAIFRRCELVLAVRLHAAVLASSALVPTVAISYGPKMEGYMKHIGQEASALGLDTLDKDDLLVLLERSWHSREDTRRELAITMREMRRLAVANAKQAASLAT